LFCRHILPFVVLWINRESDYKLRSIGIRVSPSEIFFCVIEKIDDELDIINIDSIIVPKALSVPDQLSFIRTNLISIFNEFKILFAGIRIHEGNTQNLSIERIYLEGVIQELLASCNVHNYFLGTLSSISALIEEKIQSIKDFINGENNLIELEDVPKSAKGKRESIITAIAAAELKEIRVIV
jgi:hypothetical protein